MALVLPLTTAATAEGEKPGKMTLGSFFSDAWISTRIETDYFFDREINMFDADVEMKTGSEERDHLLQDVVQP